MYRRTLAYFLRTLFSLVAASCLVIQSGGTSAVAAQLSPQQVSQFLADSSRLIADNPDGGSKLAASVRDLLLSDSSPPAVLNSLVALLKNLNTSLRSATITDAQKLAITNQISAIGSGMGQAALALAATNPAQANQIQALLASSGVQLAIASYLAVTGNVQIAAGGGGGAGGGLSTGAPMGGGGGGGQSTGATTSPSTGGGLTGGGSVTGGTTATSKVSPD